MYALQYIPWQLIAATDWQTKKTWMFSWAPNSYPTILYFWDLKQKLVKHTFQVKIWVDKAVQRDIFETQVFSPSSSPVSVRTVYHVNILIFDSPKLQVITARLHMEYHDVDFRRNFKSIVSSPFFKSSSLEFQLDKQMKTVKCDFAANISLFALC